MRILDVLPLLATLVPAAIGFKTNRTSCFHYVSCLESIQNNLKQCAGGSAISLTLEAKDVNIRDLVKYRALEFVGCQDRLLKETVDFEALQVLVNEDARECFEKLPESSKRVEEFTDSCDYVQPVSRNASKGDSLQCLIEFKQDREYCESLLECCPDHTRCGERMNAVSLSYQNARVKAEQIVYSMISCIVVNDPRFLREGARLQALRDPYRNAGVPFLRPDAYTEARITRRLALTSTSTLSQRRERFLKKYTQVRQLVTQNLFGQQKPVVDEVKESSSNLEKSKITVSESPEVPQSPETTAAPESPEASASATAAPESTTTPLAEILAEMTTEQTGRKASDKHINTIRSLIRNASEQNLSKYVTLISEGKFSELFALAEQKAVEPQIFDEKFSAKMSKLKELITETLSEKSVEVEKPEETTEKPELTFMEEPAVFTIAEDKKEKATEARLANTIVDRTSRNVAEAEASVVEEKVTTTTEPAEVNLNLKKSLTDPEVDEKAEGEKPVKQEKKYEKEDEPLLKVIDDKERALLVESEIKKSADESKSLLVKSLDSLKSEEATVVLPDEMPVLEREDSAEKKATETTTVTEETSTEPIMLKSELLTNPDETLPVTGAEAAVEGSGQEEETTSVESPVSSTPEPEGVIADVKKIRPRNEQTHCQQYASCWQTVIDYEQQCDRKYSTEVLSHGIDDSEILNILHNSSISHHEIVLKACLRPLDRSVHSSLKQLLVIQRGVRKACLELGRNKIAVTDAEEALCNTDVPSTASIDEFLSSVHVRSQSNQLMCRAKLEPIREACSIVRNCCASVDTCDNYISSSPVKKLETEAVRRLVKRQNDCETKMLQTLTYIHEQLSNPSRRRRFYYH
uniref:Chondroitin proteoglycan 4 domain-containing protein n=1 Tax=Caenorhabditis japonica TaxID=281687 RepID=A0A8R1HVR3_CAEJA